MQEAPGLTGLRVVEVAQMVAGPYAGKTLADLGADVIKVEPLSGDRARRHGPFPPNAENDPEQSGLFLGVNTNKRSIALDLTSDAGRHRLAELVAQADIVIHDLPPSRANDCGLDGAELLAADPSLVVCAITPFGHTGPHREWQGEEITSVHGGGWGKLIPGDEPNPDVPPLTVFGHPASCQAGLAGAVASLGAYYKARATGCGEYIDVSTMTHVAAMLEAAFIAWSYVGQVASRSNGHLLNPWGIHECADGLIFLVTVEQDQWLRFIAMMGNPEWASLEIFADAAQRSANQDVLKIYIEEWTRKHTVDELFHEGQRNRICFAPVFTMADLADQEHLAERGFFHSINHEAVGTRTYMGSPCKFDPDPWRLRTPAPALNAHPDAHFTSPQRDQITPDAVPENTSQPTDPQHRRPLDGVSVIDFSWVWAGPFATMHLAQLGAEVIKIESSQRPGLGRRLAIHPPELEPTLNTSGYFNQWEQGKKSVDLDLTDPTSHKQVLQLVASADVVIDNYATGVMDRLGLSDETLRSVNPDIIIASVTGFGHTGPLANYMGYGPTTAPLSGLASMTGHLGGAPQEAGISFGDPAAGLAAAFGVVSALVTRQSGAGPSRIDASLWEATAVNAIEGWMAHALDAPPFEPMGSRSPVAAPHGVFRCAGDDAWVSIACVTDEEWTSFATVLDETMSDSRFFSTKGRKANETELESAVAAYTADKDPWSVTEQLQALGIAAYPSLSCPELEHSPQLMARDFWQRFEHPEVGVRTHSGVAWQTQHAPNGMPHRAPLLGEHTNEVLDRL